MNQPIFAPSSPSSLPLPVNYPRVSACYPIIQLIIIQLHLWSTFVYHLSTPTLYPLSPITLSSSLLLLTLSWLCSLNFLSNFFFKYNARRVLWPNDQTQPLDNYITSQIVWQLNITLCRCRHALPNVPQTRIIIYVGGGGGVQVHNCHAGARWKPWGMNRIITFSQCNEKQHWTNLSN